MEVKINLDYNSYDELFLQMIYEGYDACYTCYKEDMGKYLSDPVRYEFKNEDIMNCEAVLDAYEVLADYYTAGDSWKKKIQEIKDRTDYKIKIMYGMSDYDRED
jgi:hypothetical protein